MGGASDKPVTQTNKVELSKEQKELYGIAKPLITEAANKPLEIFPGVTLAGFNPNEVAGQNQLLQAAGGTVDQLANAGANANMYMLDPSKMLAPNQYTTAYGDTLVSQLTQNLQRNILPNIGRQTEVAMGPYGATSRQGIREGIAIGDTARAGGDALAKLYSDSYGQGLTAMGRAQALNPQTIASMLTGGQVQSAVGEQQRAMQQAGIDQEIEKYYLQQKLPMMRAQDIMAMMNGMPGATGVSTVQGATPGKSAVMGGLGGAASGAALGSAIMPGIGTAVGAGIGGLLGLFG